MVVLGLYAFFLFEFILHSCTTHSHAPSVDGENSSSAEVFLNVVISGSLLTEPEVVVRIWYFAVETQF